MHLADGTLPLIQGVGYAVVSGAFVASGIRKFAGDAFKRLDNRILCGVFAAFAFVVTIFEIPMPFGSTEHPTGTPLMAVFTGPLITSLLAAIVLLLELFFREGGITTFGANVFSLGIVGGTAGWGVFYLLRRFKLGLFAAGFAAGFLGDLCVYLTTAVELSLGHYQGKSFLFYFIAFVPGQVPLAILEGIFTGLVLQFLFKRRPEMLREFKVID